MFARHGGTPPSTQYVDSLLNFVRMNMSGNLRFSDVKVDL